MLLRPDTSERLAEALREAASRGGVELGGAFTKRAMGGPVAPAETTISTACLNRVLQYEPRDLTISVEAGLPYAELTRILAGQRQMLPLDPPFADSATVGGVVAANCSGPRRRAYGTARDLVIGMKFATTAGKLVQSGGMVVKNVAGLDMAKLMVGSFGTLAAIAVVNFKVLPEPQGTRTFALAFDSGAEAAAARDRILDSVLQPVAIDALNPAAAARVGLAPAFTLVVQGAGNAAVLDRFSRAPIDERVWREVREFTPAFLAAHPEGAVVRVSHTLSATGAILESTEGPVVSRAGSGVSYCYFEDAGRVREAKGKRVVEYAPPEKKSALDLWPEPGNDLDLMRRVKRFFDPAGVLNVGRLYGRI